MANPQLENGYIRIATEIIESLASNRLSGQEYQIIFALFRKTYGFNKKEDEISMSQFSKMTGISRPKIAHLLKSLLSKKVIGVTQKGNSSINTYYFQKDFSLWGVLPKKATVTQKGNTLLPKKATEVLPKKVHTINNIKDTYTKDNIKDSWSNYFDLFWKAYPRKVAKQAAIKAFSKLNPDTALLEVILKSIQLAKLSKDWLRDGGQFIPHPATWLNGRRWEDEPTKQPMVNHAAGIINWLHKQKGGVNEPEG